MTADRAWISTCRLYFVIGFLCGMANLWMLQVLLHDR